MDLGDIVLQIRNATTMFGNKVAGAADLPTAEENRFNNLIPSAFVVPINEKGEEPEADAGLDLYIKERFSVLAVLENDAKKLGKLAFDQVKTARSQLFKAILNWQPPDAREPIMYEGGQLEDLNRAYVAYRFDFYVKLFFNENDAWQPTEPAAFERAHLEIDRAPADGTADAIDDVYLTQE